MSIIKKCGYIISACFVALLILLNLSREQELEDHTPPTPEVEIVMDSLSASADWLSSEGQHDYELGALSAEELKQQYWFPMESVDGSEKGFRRYFSGSGWVKL